MCPFLLAIYLAIVALFFAFCFTENRRLMTGYVLAFFLTITALAITHVFVIHLVAVSLFGIFIVAKADFALAKLRELKRYKFAGKAQEKILLIIGRLKQRFPLRRIKLRLQPLTVKKINLSLALILLIGTLGIYYSTTFDVGTFNALTNFYFTGDCFEAGINTCFEAVYHYIQGGYETRTPLKKQAGEQIAPFKAKEVAGENIMQTLNYAFYIYLLIVPAIGFLFGQFKDLKNRRAFNLVLGWAFINFAVFVLLQYVFKMFSIRVLYIMVMPLSIASAFTIIALRDFGWKKILAVIVIGFVVMAAISPLRLYANWSSSFVYPQDRGMAIYLNDYIFTGADANKTVKMTGASNAIVLMMAYSGGRTINLARELENGASRGWPLYSSDYLVLDQMSEEWIGRRISSYEDFRIEVNKFYTRRRADKIYDNNFSTALELLGFIQWKGYQGSVSSDKKIIYE